MDRLRGALGLFVVIGTVWLAGQVVISLLIQRAPPGLALRISPSSPLALARAAESELAADRPAVALALSRDSLHRAPFSARALRVAGIALDRTDGDSQMANEAVTLAGNWSLRDDPSHAWLIERRLKDRQYVSAFAHADTLLRRRPDLNENLFAFFDNAASLPAAAAAITRLVAAEPSWRSAYLAHLAQDGGSTPWMLTLSANLQRTKAPLTDVELESVYWALLRRKQLIAVPWLADQLNRPSATPLLPDGNFEGSGVAPFSWNLMPAVGVTAEIVKDDLGALGSSLRVEYDGYTRATVADHLARLPPGNYVLSGRWRSEASGPNAGISLTVVCLQSSTTVGTVTLGVGDGATSGWTAFSAPLTIPDSCLLQWARVATVAGDRRSFDATWIDQLAIVPASS